MNKKDIRSKEDIKLMVDTFYQRALKNEPLKHIFENVAAVNFETHLPVMYEFWSQVLFANGDYRGNPFEKHLPLPLTKNHFDLWIGIFCSTVDDLFEGNKAEEAKARARTIGQIFQMKMKLL